MSLTSYRAAPPRVTIRSLARPIAFMISAPGVAPSLGGLRRLDEAAEERQVLREYQRVA